MPTINDAILDAALNVLNDATTLHICSQEPASFADVATYSLGSTTPTFSAIEDGAVSGRRVRLQSGTLTASGTGNATHYALVTVDTLYKTQALSAPTAVTNGLQYTYAAFTVVEFRDPQTI